MTIYVSQEVENAINAAVQSGRYASADDMVTKLVQADVERAKSQAARSSQDKEPVAATPTHKPIWEVAAEIRKSIPAEEWDKLPTDGARQLDHYIYGSPKRPPA